MQPCVSILIHRDKVAYGTKLKYVQGYLVIRATGEKSMRTNHIDSGFDSFFEWRDAICADPDQALKPLQA